MDRLRAWHNDLITEGICKGTGYALKTRELQRFENLFGKSLFCNAEINPLLCYLIWMVGYKFPKTRRQM